MKKIVFYLILFVIIISIFVFLNTNNNVDLIVDKGKYLPLIKSLYLLGMVIGIAGAFKVFKKLRNTN